MGNHPSVISEINNAGGGFADYVDIGEGTTAQELFEQQVRSPNPENYLIRAMRAKPVGKAWRSVEG